MIAGGGTGGHVSPGIAIAEALEQLEPGIEVFFMGRSGSIEERLVGRTGRSFVAVPSKGLRRGLYAGNVAVPFVVGAGYLKALAILAARRPAAAVGTGGFVSLPPMAAALSLGVPVVLQEQNSYPGLATRLLSSMAAGVHTSFEETASFLPRARRIELSGNPVRSALSATGREAARERLGLPQDARVVLFVGGSRGASRINAAVSDAARRLSEADVALIVQTGHDEIEDVRCALEPAGARAVVEPFFDDMASAYAASDLVVSRSGATAIAEIELVGRPSILVPYPYATEDHQTKNAWSVVKGGAATVIPDGELTGERLADEVLGLIEDGARLALMAQRARTLARPDAAERVAESVLALARSGRVRTADGARSGPEKDRPGDHAKRGPGTGGEKGRAAH
jgi:UDP-N-acetylglucosamine--N-acetylmuramyl-(pentapeptide) pyrophosphoryl-undecaprenol N-acetylglucosamine transferase